MSIASDAYGKPGPGEPAPCGWRAWRPTPSRVLLLLVWLAIVVFVIALAAGQFSSYLVFTVTTIGIYATAAIGQDWLVGQAGQVSLGGAAFMSLGAFTVVLTQNSPLHAWPVQAVLAGLVGGVVGLITGLTALRLRRFYLLLATLALQYIIVTITQLYQGNQAQGFTIALPSIGSWVIGSSSAMLIFTLVILVAVALFTTSLQRRAPGRYWRAIRENEVAARSLGLGVVRWKLAAFVGSSAMTAIAGAMYAWIVGLVTYDTFSLQLALSIAVMVFFGGRGSILGPVIGAAAVTLLPQGLDNLATSLGTGGGFGEWLTNNDGSLATGIYGLVLLLVLLTEPQGIIGICRGIGRFLDGLATRKERPAAGTQPAATPADGPFAAAAVGEPARPEGGAAARPHDEEMPHQGMVVLAVEHAGVRYQNGATGIEDLSMSVSEGSIVGLVGRNGSGKTSTLRLIAGFPPDERVRVHGDLAIDGRLVKRHDPRSMRKRGVVLVPERDKCFPSLTVAEHFQAARVPTAEMTRLFEVFPNLGRLRNRRSGFLSGGERQTLALAIAIAAHPRVLLIDEPSLGLAPVISRTLISSLLQMREADPRLSVILAEQAIEVLRTVADRVYVLDDGRAVHCGTVDLLNRDDVREAVMGR